MDLDDDELIATRKLHMQDDGLYEDKKIQKDKEIDILIKAKRKLREEYDTEAAKIIIEKCLLGPWIITRGRIDYIKLALKVILSEQEKDKKRMQELQKEIDKKDTIVRGILKRLDNDYKKITETKNKKYNIHDYTRCRLKAYRTKTRELKEYIEKQYFGERMGEDEGC